MCGTGDRGYGGERFGKGGTVWEEDGGGEWSDTFSWATIDLGLSLTGS